MTLNKTVDENEKKLTVEIIGRLDTRTSPQFETEMLDSLTGIETLELDFAQLDYVSSAGLRTLLKIQKQMNTQGEMTIINASETIKEVFELTGFIDIFNLG